MKMSPLQATKKLIELEIDRIKSSNSKETNILYIVLKAQNIFERTKNSRVKKKQNKIIEKSLNKYEKLLYKRLNLGKIEIRSAKNESKN